MSRQWLYPDRGERVSDAVADRMSPLVLSSCVLPCVLVLVAPAVLVAVPMLLCMLSTVVAPPLVPLRLVRGNTGAVAVGAVVGAQRAHNACLPGAHMCCVRPLSVRIVLPM